MDVKREWPIPAGIISDRIINRRLIAAKRVLIHYCILGGMGDRVIFQGIIRHAMATRNDDDLLIAVIPYHKDEYDARRYSPAPDEIWVVPEKADPLARAMQVREAAKKLLPDAHHIKMMLYGYFDAAPDVPEMTCVDMYVRLGELQRKGVFPEFIVNAAANEHAKKVIRSIHAGKSTPLIAVHYRVLSGESVKNISADCFLKLVEKLKTTLCADLILVGGKEGAPGILLEKVRYVTPADASLQESAAFISNCDLFIGGDSGPIHLAAAVGVPVILIRPEAKIWKNGPFLHEELSTHCVGFTATGSSLLFDVGQVLASVKNMLNVSRKPAINAPRIQESNGPGRAGEATTTRHDLTVSYIIFNTAWASFIERQGVMHNEQKENAYRTKSSIDEYVNYLIASLATLGNAEPLANYPVRIYLVELELNDFAQRIEMEIQRRLPALAFHLNIIRQSEIAHLIDWELRAPSNLHRSPNKIHEFAIYQAIMRCETRYLYLSDPDTIYFAPGYFDFALSHMLKGQKAVASIIDMGRQITKDGETFHMRKRMHTISLFADVVSLPSKVDLEKDLSKQLDTGARVDLIPSGGARDYYRKHRQIDTLSYLTEHLTDPAKGGLLCELNGKFHYFHEGEAMVVVCDYFAHGHYRDQAVQMGLLNSARQSPVYHNLLKAINYVSMLGNGER